jgi:hypothetical protein
VAPRYRGVGVLCDGGNRQAVTSDPTQIPEANTILENLTIGPNYITAVQVINATKEDQGGCNLRMSSNLLAGDLHGAEVGSCGTKNLGNSIEATGNLFLYMPGGGLVTSSGTTFSSPGDGAGVWAFSCVDLVRIVGNRFDTIQSGIRLEKDLEQALIDIEDNTFTRPLDSAIGLYYKNVVDVFSGNRIQTCKTGIHIQEQSSIRRARHNSILGCDTAVLIESTDLSAIDFGTDNDWGDNVFACNKGPSVQLAPKLVATGTLQLAGNTWDHSPPDVLDQAPAPQPPIDTAFSSSASETCF